jgi:hypothetical protein
MQQARVIWLPYDQLDLALYDNNEDQGNGASVKENALVAYATQCPASAAFNLEIFLNFEVTPLAGSIISGMGAYCDETTDPTDVALYVRSRPDLICSSYFSQHSELSKGLTPRTQLAMVDNRSNDDYPLISRPNSETQVQIGKYLTGFQGKGFNHN